MQPEGGGQFGAGEARTLRAPGRGGVGAGGNGVDLLGNGVPSPAGFVKYGCGKAVPARVPCGAIMIRAIGGGAVGAQSVGDLCETSCDISR